MPPTPPGFCALPAEPRAPDVAWQVVLWQKDIVAACLQAGKPVIVATQMLETMQKNPRPTRAEVADVTNAVLDGADAVMLSGESANGKYPDASVATQAEICHATEEWAKERGFVEASLLSPVVDVAAEAAAAPLTEMQAALACSAGAVATEAAAAAVVVVEAEPEALLRGRDSMGALSRAVSAGQGGERPTVPIVSLSTSLKVCRQLSLSRGVRPVHVAAVPGSAAEAVQLASDAGLVEKGQCVLVVTPEALTTAVA